MAFNGILIIFIGLQCIGTTRSDATLSIHMVKFDSYGLDIDGRSCDIFPRSPCDPAFKFCFKYPNGTSLTNRGCYQTRRFTNQDSIVFGDDMEGVSNPIEMTLGRWTGRFIMTVTVTDEDFGRDELDSLSLGFNEQLTNRSELRERLTITGTRQKQPSRLSLEVNVRCGKHYYGPHCDIYCQPRNNDLGHYSCESVTGVKLCLPGYEDPATNCTSPLTTKGAPPTTSQDPVTTSKDPVVTTTQAVTPADYCQSHSCHNAARCKSSPHNYFCSCPIGFTGSLCETEVSECESSPCQYGGTCYDVINGYDCACPLGRKGAHCQYNACGVDWPCASGGEKSCSMNVTVLFIAYYACVYLLQNGV